MALPAPAMARYLVATRQPVARHPRRQLDRPAASVHRCRDAVALEYLHDAPPAGAGAVLEMAFHAGIRRADDLLDDVVHALVPLVALTDGELGTLLDIDDERDRNTGIVRPAHGRRPPTIAAEIACP